MRDNKNLGFTVLELLLVCLICLSVGILVLSYGGSGPGRVGEKARRAQCNNNLRQIGLACAAYYEYTGNRLPSGRSSVFSNMTYLADYLGSPKLLICPSSQKTPAASFTISNPTDAAVSYSYQAGATNSLAWTAETNKVVMWDQGVVGSPGGSNGGIGLAWASTSNHKGAGGYVLFTDGHVAFHTKTPTNMPLGCQNP